MLFVLIIGIGTNLSVSQMQIDKPIFRKTLKKKTISEVYYQSLNFSNEHLPVGDTKTQSKIKKTLATHHYNNLQTTKLHTKAQEWFPIIEPILKQYGIPKDFRYMPLVESGLRSGTSSKGASGHWQFMPQTARDFGLRVNLNVDERKDMRKSTIAACKYLKFLYSEFKSWTLAAAAYNGGEGSVKRQIIQHNHKNYFKMTLNAETASYVYKLIAMKEIIENPSLHGYKSNVDTNSKQGLELVPATSNTQKAVLNFSVEGEVGPLLLASESF